MMNPNYLAIIMIAILILGLMFIVAAMHALEVKADTLISHCPEDGCVFLDKSYYSDYEYGSKEYWRSYCNSFIGTKWECR